MGSLQIEVRQRERVLAFPALERSSHLPSFVSSDSEMLSAALGEAGLQDIVSPHAAHGVLVSHVLASHGYSVWVQDFLSASELGSLSSRIAFTQSGRARVLRVLVRNAHDALWAMEEAVKAGVNVIGEIHGSPRLLNFTATRRLEFFSRAAGVTCVLVRLGADADITGSSGARWRWRIQSMFSDINRFDSRSPGKSRWSLELVRARSRPPGRWVVEFDEPRDDKQSSNYLRVVSPLATGDVETVPAAECPVQTGNVISLR